jgi:hypothetical protein
MGTMSMNEFTFHTKLDQTILLGVKARNIQGLLEGVRQVPESSIYYHTHRFLQQHHYLSPEPPNDFAYWVSNVMGDDVLGEQLSSVDIIQFHTINELRVKFITILESHLDSLERLSMIPPGEEFHFMASRLFVLPTQHVARTLQEFLDCLGRVSVNSLYYHIFDAKLRLERHDNDFSRWFTDLGLLDLAEELRRLDPYAHTLEGLRKRIIVLVKKHDQH